MTRMMRKYQKWMIVGFGVLLMLAFTAQPAIERFGQAVNNRKIGRVNDTALRASDLQLASREHHAFSRLATVIPFFDLGFAEQGGDVQWLLLTREAEAAGLIGEAENGQAFLDGMAEALSLQMEFELSRTNFQYMMERQQARQRGEEQERAYVNDLLQRIQNNIKQETGAALIEAGLQGEEAQQALAKLQGVHQLRLAYASAPRLSDRAAHMFGKREHDAAVGDFLFIPASKLTAGMPEPDERSLQAHFDRFRDVRPGEGDYGVGYLLPQRIKLEYLKLDRVAIEQAVQIDPVAVNKFYRQNRTEYPGDYAVERPNIESRLRSKEANDILQEAHTVVQREVQKVTRNLDLQGRVRKLPTDWDSRRPRLQAIASAIVEHFRTTRNLTIPEPEVVVLNEWQPQDELTALPGIGMSTLGHGGMQAPFSDVAFWVHELGSAGGFLTVQTGLPLTEAPLEDPYTRDRYYFTVLDTRGESPPDTMAEIRDRVADDYQQIAAFEQIKGQLQSLQQTAAAEGLSKIAEMYDLKPAPAEIPDPNSPPPADPVRSGVRISRAQASGGVPALQEQAVRELVMQEVARLDPVTPADQIPPEESTVVVPAPKQLGIAIFRITALQPVTREAVQYPQNDRSFAEAVMASEEMPSRLREAFSLAALLKRNTYILGDRRIATPEELRKSEES